MKQIPAFVAATLLAAAARGTTVTGTTHITINPPPGTLSIRASGNHLVDGNGNPIQLRGVNVSGMEGTSFFNDPWRGNIPNAAALKSWGINVLRIPVSESNWLGNCSTSVSNGVGASQFQSDIASIVSQMNNAGIYVIIDLHWIGVPNICPGGQNDMADTTYSQTFWSQVAAAYKNNHGVILEVFNEPVAPNTPPTFAEFTNYLNGGLTGPQDIGANTLIGTMRAAGATNLIILDCLDYAIYCTNWQNPTDPLHNYAASMHYYQGTFQEAPANLILASGIPLTLTEYGDNNVGDGDTANVFAYSDPGGRASQYLTSVGQAGAAYEGVSYVAWTWNWNGWGGIGNYQLIQDASGTVFPGSPYATEVHSHYLCRAAGNTNCP